MGLPLPIPEHVFHPTRKWRFDFAWPEYKVALEVDGGIWIKGGHNRGAQMKLDWEKQNNAAILGWRILKCEPHDLMRTQTIEILKQCLTCAKPS